MTSELGSHEGAKSSTCGQTVRNPRHCLGLPGETQASVPKLSFKEDYDGIPDKFGDPRVEIQPGAYLKEHRQNFRSKLVGATKHSGGSGVLTRDWPGCGSWQAPGN